MPRSIGSIVSPRFSVDGFRGDSPTFIPSCSDVVSRRSYSYHKLPQLLFKLSILKLDGSSFDIQVARTASVAEVKQAIEDSFNSSPKEDRSKISWSHVWGHFCLCFEGQKLVNDKACIKSFGIKDGDQLCFIRHLSINYCPIKKSKSYKAYAYHEQETTFSSGLNSHEEEEQRHEDEEQRHEDEERHENDEYYYGDQERMDEYFRIEDGKSGDIVCHTQFKLAHFLRGWLSYSRLWSRRKSRSHSKTHPSRLAGHFLRVETKATLL